MLELQNLCRNFRGIPAIEGVSFKVAPGEIVGFLGLNGAGKSTTVKIITGMLRANEGRVLFEGQDVRKDMVKLLADAPPAELTTLMRLPTLESVFAQLVRKQDTRSIAQEIVAVMQLDHA